MNRRKSIKYTAEISAALGFGFLPWNPSKLRVRTIPGTEEKIPIVGLGTWQTFDVGSSSEERAPLKEVLNTLVKMGGSVVDSSPMYGQSEQVVGDLSGALDVVDRLFIATKVWTSGAEAGKQQMMQSIRRMGKNPIDLMQIHNLLDWKTHLPLLFKWKEEGKIRYVGITHYLESAYGEMEKIMSHYPLDFVQINYSISSRAAENRLLPLAADKGIGILTNRPYEGGSLFRKVRGKELPSWSQSFDCHSWGQFFLKYILSNQAVSCAIPGTSKTKHLIDNLGAGMRRMPTEAQRLKMINYFKTL